ncbi:MAG: thrombospondin type 3 repeat-containing protein, partial [Pseudomonadota bacterium]
MTKSTRALGLWGVLCFFVLGLGAGAQTTLSEEPMAPQARVDGHALAVIGERVQLDATASVDGDSERLSYSWTLDAPAGSGARLSDASSPRPFFEVDLIGDYTARVVVSDGQLDSLPAEVRVSTQHAPPFVVTPMTELAVARGQTASLDARDVLSGGSEPARYEWSIEQAPALSRAALSDTRTPVVAIAPDAAGTYVLLARAKNARGESAEARFQLHTDRAVPAFALDAERRLPVGSTVALADAMAVANVERADVQWQLRHAPRGSRAALSHADRLGAELYLDAPGLYVAQLVVSAEGHRSPAQTLVVEAVTPLDGHAQPIGSPLTGQLYQVRGGSDIDGDGVPDDIDNCVETPNPNQIDTNNDGFGNRCDPDLDNDGLITNTIDLGLLRLAFFSRPGDANWNPDADFNSDGVINVIELGILRQFFFNAPGPIANVFTNPAGGSWHEPTNWSLGFVPNAAHAVRIDLAPGVEVEYSTGDTQISSIRTTSPLVFSGGTLNVTRLAEFNDTVTMSGTAT